VRAFRIRRRGRATDRQWPDRMGAAVVTGLALLILTASWRGLQRHDALTRWRMDIEGRAGRPPWPTWHANWPRLALATSRVGLLETDVRGAYTFIAEHPSLARRVRCYCGCGGRLHQSLWDCFIAGLSPGGDQPVWELHATRCVRCIRIAREVLLLTQVGTEPSRVGEIIDARYRGQQLDVE